MARSDANWTDLFLPIGVVSAGVVLLLTNWSSVRTLKQQVSSLETAQGNLASNVRGLEDLLKARGVISNVPILMPPPAPLPTKTNERGQYGK